MLIVFPKNTVQKWTKKKEENFQQAFLAQIITTMLIRALFCIAFQQSVQKLAKHKHSWDKNNSPRIRSCSWPEERTLHNCKYKHLWKACSMVIFVKGYRYLCLVLIEKYFICFCAPCNLKWRKKENISYQMTVTYFYVNNSISETILFIFSLKSLKLLGIIRNPSPQRLLTSLLWGHTNWSEQRDI